MEQEAGKISKKRGSEVSPLALYLLSTRVFLVIFRFFFFSFLQQRFRRGEGISAEEEEGRTENPVFRFGCQVDGLRLGLRQLLRREEELQRLRHLAGLGQHEEGKGEETEGTQTP